MMIKFVLLLLALFAIGDARADEFMTLKAAGSSQLSGLLDYILPIFERAANLNVHVVAVDPGQSAASGERGDADALLLGDRSAEDRIVADGDGLNRRDAMYDDFVIVGPHSDPAGIRGLPYAGKALAQIAAKSALFVSPGPDGSANRMELRLWKSAGTKPDTGTAWYRAAARGTAATLDMAAAMDAYTVADRATWADFKKRQSLEILVEGDPALFDVYGSILISSAKWPQTKFAYARIWHDWLTDKHGSAAIASYKINGEQIFFPCQGATLAVCRNASGG